MIKKTIILLFLMIVSTLKTYSQCDSVRIENHGSDHEGDLSYSQEIIHYSPSGKIMEIIYKYQSDPGSEWSILFIDSFQYDMNDSLLRHYNINYSSSGNTFYEENNTFDQFGNLLTNIVTYNSNITSSDTNTFNSVNHLLEQIRYRNSIRTRKVYSYNLVDSLVSDLFMKWDGSTWIDSVRTDYYYDGTGNRITHSVLQEIAGNWDSTFIGYYFYNDSNLVDTFYTMKDSASIWINDSMQINTYGALNKRTHLYFLKWNQSQSQWLYLSDVVTEVDSNGYPSLNVTFTAYYFSGTLVWDQSEWRIEEFHDSIGNLLSTSSSFPPFESSLIFTYTNGVLTSSVGGSSSNMTSTDYYSNYYYAELFGDTLICQGENPVLFVDSCSGDSFLWSSGETTSSIVATTSGNYQVTITRPNGWVVQTPPVHVTMASAFAIPNIVQGVDSSVILCAGDSATLFTPIQSGVNYQWYRNSVTLSGLDTNFITLTSNFQSGNYVLIGSNICGTSTSSKTHLDASHLTISSNAIHTTCIGCNDGEFRLNVFVGTYPYSISITPNIGVISGDTILNLSPGVYEICVTDGLGCTTCLTDEIFEDPTGVNIVSEKYFNVYPNPFWDILTIISENEILGEGLSISDLPGKVVLKGKLVEKITKVDLESLSPGIYFLKINSMNDSAIPIIKK